MTQLTTIGHSIRLDFMDWKQTPQAGQLNPVFVIINCTKTMSAVLIENNKTKKQQP